MGCDIHMIVQQKDANGVWQTVPGLGYDHRNYDLFAMLADVRNGYGFAGVDTGDGFLPLLTAIGEDNPRRGIPIDLKMDPNGYGDYTADGEWLGDHSYSWLTLTEALGPDVYYERTSNHRGVVGEAGYKEFKSTGYPDGYCGSISGLSVRNVSVDAMEGIIANPSLKEEGCFYYTQVQWPETYRESAGEAWFKLLEELKQIDPNTDNVRLVFGFDS